MLNKIDIPGTSITLFVNYGQEFGELESHKMN